MADDHGTVLTLDDRDLLRRLDDLGVGQLRTDGPTPPTDGWADVERRSSRRHRRHVRTLRAAVALVLVALVVAAVAIGRIDDRASTVIGNPGGPVALVPTDPTATVSTSDLGRADPTSGAPLFGYSISYFGSDGSPLQLTYTPTATLDPWSPIGPSATHPVPAEEVHLHDRATWPALELDGPIAGARLRCQPVRTSVHVDPAHPELGPRWWAPFVEVPAGAWTIDLAVASPIRYDARLDCDLDAAADRFERVLSELRPLDQAGWRRYVEEQPEPTDAAHVFGDQPAAEEEPLPGGLRLGDDERAEVADAAAHLLRTDDGGRFVSLERAEELTPYYSHLLDGSLIADPGSAVEVGAIRFVTEEEAEVWIQVRLGPGLALQSVSLHGRALREGSGWVISVDTLESLVWMASPESGPQRIGGPDTQLTD